ncbi:hypothetical protein KAR91_39025, partial [Candidatus Pacearchaeota archaeon]|nr:hypothetical protein [Candidatus Pacearchaeota archaeon]
MNIADELFAARIGMSVEEIKPIIKYLASPDPKSNIKAYKGRRIIALSKVDEIEENRGYLVVNKQFYAEKGNPRTSAQRVSKHRKKEKILQLFNELNVCNITETLS